MLTLVVARNFAGPVVVVRGGVLERVLLMVSMLLAVK